MIQINRIDHLVMTVHDIDKTCEFYTQALGMEVITFGDNRKALLFGPQKINLHQYGAEFEPKAAQPGPGSQDLCFIVEQALDEVIAHLGHYGIEIIDGPVERSGASGTIKSVYCRDPDGNLIELSVYLQR